MIGASRAVVEVDDNRMELSLRATKASCKVESPSVDNIASSLLTHIQHFPYTIQMLLLEEAHGMNTRIAKGKRPPGLKDSLCGCDFYNKYLLPCRHVMHAALFGDLRSAKEPALLDDADWMCLQNKFTAKNEGLDVYRTRYSVTVNGREIAEKTAEQAGNAEVDKLKMEELFESSQQLYQGLVDRGDLKELEAFVADFEAISTRRRFN